MFLFYPYLVYLYVTTFLDDIDWSVLLYTGCPLTYYDNIRYNSLSNSSIINSDYINIKKIRIQCCGFINSVVWYYLLSDFKTIKYVDLERNFVSIGHNGREFIYLLDESGFVWKFNTQEDIEIGFYSLSFIPLINTFTIVAENKVYLVGKDGSLWYENGSDVNKIIDSDVLNVFSGSSNTVFVLCKHGRILKGEGDQFSEFCRVSNVISISACTFAENSVPIFLLDNGRVYCLKMDNKINYLASDTKSIFGGALQMTTLTNDGELKLFRMLSINQLDLVLRSKTFTSIFVTNFSPILYRWDHDRPVAIIIGSNNEFAEITFSKTITHDHDLFKPVSRSKSARK